jgi:hypothetical protein
LIAFRVVESTKPSVLGIAASGHASFGAMVNSLNSNTLLYNNLEGGLTGMIAPLIGLQPKHVMVWVLESGEPAVARIVGQLGGFGPVLSSELEGTGFGK